MSKNNKKQQKTTKSDILRPSDPWIQPSRSTPTGLHTLLLSGPPGPQGPNGSRLGTQEDLQEDQEEVLRPVIRS